MNSDTQNQMKSFIAKEFFRLCPKIKDIKDISTNKMIPLYKVQLQNELFVVPLEDAELLTCIDYSFKIMDLFEVLINSGFTKDSYTTLYNTLSEDYPDILRSFYFFDSDRIKNVINIITLANEIAAFRRIGGAYWMMLKSLPFYDILLSVLTVIMEDFSDEKRYLECVFILLRTILYLHDYQE